MKFRPIQKWWLGHSECFVEIQLNYIPRFLLCSNDMDMLIFKCSGYMSLEYAMHDMFSKKSDVFSFGVLLLEIVRGRRSTSFDDDEQYLSLVGFVSPSDLLSIYLKL
jgi:serine/threonine protein kinase